MTKLSTILDQPARQLTIEELLAILDAENRDDAPPESVATVSLGDDHGQIGVIEEAETGLGSHRGDGIRADDRDGSPPGGNGLEPGASVGHADFADFRAVYIGPGRRPGVALVKVTAGWSGELPTWPVSVPYSKLTEV